MTNASNLPAPRHTHDCDCCVYLGQHGEFDLYAHAQGSQSVVARYGANAEYTSGLEGSYGHNPALTEARRLAEAQGLFPFNLRLAVSYMNPAAAGLLREEMVAALKSDPLAQALGGLSGDDPIDALAALHKQNVEAAIVRYGNAPVDKVLDWEVTHVCKVNEWLQRLGLPHATQGPLLRTFVKVSDQYDT